MNAFSAYLSYQDKKRTKTVVVQKSMTIGLWLLALAAGGIFHSLIPTIQAELSYQLPRIALAVESLHQKPKQLPSSAPVVFNPLIDAEGNVITPINTEFSLIVPKIGINAPVIPNVDPTDTGAYTGALLEGVAHASTSFFPNENGVVYLFSHSTNYEWFVQDLNAVFYLLKNLEQGDWIVLVYQGTEYTYKLTEKRVVSPTDVSYLSPIEGKKMLILQTCWPPGSTTERLLVFADLVQTEKLP